ncbi:MAG: hypothetical protein ACLPU9_05045 [Thermoplasmata archaeon]
MTITRKDFDEGWIQPPFFSAVQALLNGKPSEAFSAAEIAKEANFPGTVPTLPVLTASLDEMSKRGHFETKDVLVNGEMTRYYCSTQFSRYKVRPR